MCPESFGLWKENKWTFSRANGRISILKPGHKMSLRQAIKSKFRPEKNEADRDVETPPPVTSSSFRTFNEDEFCLTHDEVLLADECVEKQCIPDSCHILFESQLNQLHEQLVGSMLENQQLVNEVKSLRDQLSSDYMAKQLEKEREKTRVLTERLQERDGKESIGSKSPRLRRLVRREKHLEKSKSLETSQAQSPQTPDREEWVDVREVVEEDGENNTEPVTFEPPPPPTNLRWTRRLWMRFHDLFYDFAEDFTETVMEDEEGIDTDREGDPLTVKRLKENIVRFGSATKPIANTIDSLSALLKWKSPGTTLLAFSAYMYTVYHGWFLPLLFFLFICQIVVNYFRHKGWCIGAAAAKRNELEEGEKDLGVSDKFQLVLHVARKVQNQLGQIADCCEKVKNLLLWKQPDVAAHLFFVLFATFLAACIFPASKLFTTAGLYLGIKLFLIDYVFYLFPRVRHKYDSSLRMWKSLPTDAQLERKHYRAEIDKNILAQGSGSAHSLTAENQSFCELFNLPPSETPLPSWHSGRRCTLINKDRSLASAFKNGRLYLTNSFLCFERSKTHNMKNLVLGLKSIIKLEKTKLYSWMPGGGMALEITLEKPERTYIFGGIINRDEVYESILEAGKRAELSWAAISAHMTEMEEFAISRKPS